MAAIAGSARLTEGRQLPDSSSRLISRPTRKKKIAIRPSLIQSSSGLSMASAPMRTATGVSRNSVVEPVERRIAGRSGPRRPPQAGRCRRRPRGGRMPARPSRDPVCRSAAVTAPLPSAESCSAGTVLSWPRGCGRGRREPRSSASFMDRPVEKVCPSAARRRDRRRRWAWLVACVEMCSMAPAADRPAMSRCACGFDRGRDDRDAGRPRAGAAASISACAVAPVPVSHCSSNRLGVAMSPAAAGGRGSPRRSSRCT